MKSEPKKYIRYVHKNESYGGNPNSPTNTNTSMENKEYVYIQNSLNETGDSILRALKEMKCCWNDILKYDNKNENKKRYIDILKGSYQDFMNSVDNYKKPVNYDIKFDVKAIYAVRMDLRNKQLNIIKFMTEQYLKFLKDFIERISKANIPIYKLDKYGRESCELVDKKTCCDASMNSNLCAFLFSSQSLTRCMMPLIDLFDRLKKLIPNFEKDIHIKSELIDLSGIVSENVKYLQDLFSQINPLVGEIMDWNKSHSISIEQCNTNMDKYQELIIVNSKPISSQKPSKFIISGVPKLNIKTPTITVPKMSFKTSSPKSPQKPKKKVVI